MRNVYLYILTKMRNVSLKHFGDSVVTFKKPITSIKSSLFFHYLSSQDKQTHRSEPFIKIEI